MRFEILEILLAFAAVQAQSSSVKEYNTCFHIGHRWKTFYQHITYYYLVTVQSHRWIQRGWTNNNAESYNHQLKLKNSWKQLGIRPLLDNIRGLIALQLSDLRRSLHGEGNFAITSVFRRHAVTYDRWITLTEDKKKRLFSRFLADCGGTVGLQLYKTGQPCPVMASCAFPRHSVLLGSRDSLSVPGTCALNDCAYDNIHVVR